MSTPKASQQLKIALTSASALREQLADPQERDALLDEALEEFLTASETLIATEEKLRQQTDALKRAHYTAETEQQRYQQLFELAPDGYLVTDLYGKIKMANRVAAGMLGVEPQYLIGKPLPNFIVLDQRRFFRQQLNRLQTDGTSERWETRLHCRHAAELDVMLAVVRSASSLAQAPAELLWQLQDMTEVKQREEAEREQSFRATFEQSPLGMGHAGQHGEWLYVNEALCAIFGCSAEELTHRSLIDMTAADDRDSARDLFRQVAQREQDTVQRENRCLHKNGALIWARINVTAIRAPSGEFLYNVVVLEDVTERKRIEVAEREQRIIAETLRDTALLLTSSLDLNEVIDHILGSIDRVVPHDAVSLLMIKDDSAYVVRARGYDQFGRSLEPRLQEFHISVDESDRIEQMLRTKNPVLLSLWTDHGKWDQVPGMSAMRSLLAAPILDRGTVIGFLKLHSRTPNFFSEEHAKLLQVIAAQAATAIVNARAYEQAQSLAVLNERHRLARELHDAVTQTLFSANMIADALPRLWQETPDPVRVQLEELQMLTHGALAEMRTLLLELRPEYLVNMDLEAQIRQLLDSVKVRKRIEVALDIQVECIIPPPVRIALYRIAQEALNNVVKHSHASVVHVTLSARPDCVQLIVEDNGIGFERQGKRSGFGLHTMTERAEEIGAALQVLSTPKSGTRISVLWNSADDG